MVMMFLPYLFGGIVLFLFKLLNLNIIFIYLYIFIILKHISLLTVVAYVTFNLVIAIKLIIQERKKIEFNKWSKQHSLITSIITLLAMSDVEALTFLNSQFAGLLLLNLVKILKMRYFKVV